MIYGLAARWVVFETDYELQQIEGDDGSVWLRVSMRGDLVAVFSAMRQGPGVMPVHRVVEVLGEAATARRPRILIHALRFLGWEFWPAVPIPLSKYLDHAFREQLREVQPNYLGKD